MAVSCSTMCCGFFLTTDEESRPVGAVASAATSRICHYLCALEKEGYLKMECTLETTTAPGGTCYMKEAHMSIGLTEVAFQSGSKLTDGNLTHDGKATDKDVKQERGDALSGIIQAILEQVRA